MNSQFFTLALTSFLTVASVATAASADVKGAATVTYESPNKLVEECVRLEVFPTGVYSKSDVKDEEKSCSINVYDPDVAMCPKSWSTSPGTVMYQISKDKRPTAAKMTQSAYENSNCAGKDKNLKKLAKFKPTMNANGTSGTFSTSSLLYYHFSRYFDTDVEVPVSVYRTLDRKEHLARVSNSKFAHTKGMNGAGWNVLRAAEQNPHSYTPTSDLFVGPANDLMYGVIVSSGGGVRYGMEVNGIRSSWGIPQNKDFQQTPGFLALKSASPISEAIVNGEKAARLNGKMNSSLGSSKIAPQQMVYWMKELTEITLLDYIFNQQDRIGNINYFWKWYWVENGSVKHQAVDDKAQKEFSRLQMQKISVPQELKAFNPVLLQRTIIGDNDAGGLSRYVNFTKTTAMVEGIRHYNKETYKKLIDLNKDFESKGQLTAYVSETFGLTPSELKLIQNNTAAVAQILQKNCAANLLKFDLDPEKFALGGAVEETVNCENP